MKVITAIEEYNKDLNEISCFLAGGITNCPNWQKDVIEILSQKEDTDDLVIYNPRRENFSQLTTLMPLKSMLFGNLNTLKL